MTERRLPKHSIVIAGHATSIALEDEFWQALKQLAKADNMALASLLARIDKQRAANNPQPSLASAARVYILKRLQGKG